MAEAVDDGRDYGDRKEMEGNNDQVIDPWCDLCYDDAGEKTDAAAFCPQCNSFLCQSCIKAHSKVPASRNHLIKRGASMLSCQNEKPIKYPNCPTHVGNLIDLFCLDHGKMACNECIKDAHGLCWSGTMEDLCKTIGPEDMLNFKENVSCISNNVTAIKLELESNINVIESKRKQLLNQTEDLCSKIITQTKDRCSELTSKINNACSEHLSRLSSQVSILSEMTHWFEKSVSVLNRDRTVNVEPNLFVRLQEITVNVQHFANDIESMINQLKKVDISLLVSPEVSAFLGGNCKLGEFAEETVQLEFSKLTDITFPHATRCAKKRDSAKQLDITLIRATKSGPLSTKHADDQFNSDIFGIDVTCKGILLIADSKNKKVKAISQDNELLSAVTLSDSPGSISILNRITAAVGCRDRKLYMINVSNPRAMTVQRTLDIGYRITGLLRYNNNIALARWGDQQSVKMLDLNGKEIWSVSTDNKETKLFKNPFALACNITMERATLIVTDWGKNALTLLDASSGQVIRTIAVDGKKPHGVTVDDDGNVYVCYVATKEISVWSADFQQSKILLSRDDLESKPRSVFFSGLTDTLYVSYCDKDNVDCFQLSYMAHQRETR